LKGVEFDSGSNSLVSLPSIKRGYAHRPVVVPSSAYFHAKSPGSPPEPVSILPNVVPSASYGTAHPEEPTCRRW
jgi:hypothetical protein